MQIVKLSPAIQLYGYIYSQNFINQLTSDFDFWKVDRYEWKEVVQTGFLKKKFETNGPFWAQKWCVLITLDLPYGFYTFFSRAKSHDKILLLNVDLEYIKVNESSLKEMVKIRQESVFSWPGRILRAKNAPIFANRTE